MVLSRSIVLLCCAVLYGAVLSCPILSCRVLSPQSRFISLKLCRYMRLTDEMGFAEAPLKVETLALKDAEWNKKANTRVVWDDVPPEESELLWERIKPHLPSQPAGMVNPEEWSAVGLTSKWRFYRYEPGQQLHPHRDVTFLPGPSNEATFTTVTLYLNEDFGDGCTTFFPDERLKEESCVRVKPEQGSAVVFPHGASRHSPLHEGSPPSSGVKYVLHTDVVYRRKEVTSRVEHFDDQSLYHCTRDFQSFFFGPPPEWDEVGMRPGAPDLGPP